MTSAHHLVGPGEEKLDEAGERRYPVRRWVVERRLGWISKCRTILVRYAKKAANYSGAGQGSLRPALVPSPASGGRRQIPYGLTVGGRRSTVVAADGLREGEG